MRIFSDDTMVSKEANMALKFPPDWYKNPDFLTGFLATCCSGSIFVELVQHGTFGYKLCLLGSIVFGGSAAVLSQFTTNNAAEKATALANANAPTSPPTPPSPPAAPPPAG
jgi:hypothetical protein